MSSPADYTDRDAAHAVLAVLAGASGAHVPGSFTSTLILAMHRADRGNLYLLTGLYPALGQAVRDYMHDVDGYGRLCKLAGIEP